MFGLEDELDAKLTTARETIARLNRRCQSAESGLAAKSTSVRFKSAVEHALRQQIELQRRLAQDDRVALDKLQAMLSGQRWDGAADLLETIAHVLETSGRKIELAGQDAPRWDTAR